MDNNRIGSACWYRILGGTRWLGGTLRSWSMDSHGSNSGVYVYPVAVIEDEKTGLCHSVRIPGICFASIPPND